MSVTTELQTTEIRPEITGADLWLPVIHHDSDHLSGMSQFPFQAKKTPLE